VSAMSQIRGVVDDIAGYQNAIAVAVEEQSASSRVIVRSINETVENSKHIADTIREVSAAADVTNSGAGGARDAARTLTEMSAQLQQVVDRFQYQPGTGLLG
jgi:methyl-accepting chemotaxis protein